MAHRRERLQRALSGHGLHPSDVTTALAWYDAEVSAGREPATSEVLARADACHATAVGRRAPAVLWVALAAAAGAMAGGLLERLLVALGVG